MLRNAIIRAPAVLSPVGSYRRVFAGHTPCTTAELLKNEEVPASLCRSLQAAVGEYLEQLTAPVVPAFVSGRSLPPESPAREITFVLNGAAEHAALDGVSDALFRRIYGAAAPGTFGDLQAMETRVDPLVRSGRELPAGRFAVSPALCTWVERTWAEHFQPARVRVEPYKINVYGPGDRFAAHRDTPEAGLVGTFLVALGGWGNPCDGGGLVVHDVGGCHRWDGATGWAAFHPFLLHEVEPVADGARMTVAFKVFAADEGGVPDEPVFDEALMNEAAERIALCQNEFGQVGVLLSFAYSLNSTALCGRDLLVYRILERLGAVESIPVAVHVDASNTAEDCYFWAADAHVYDLTPANLARILDPHDDAEQPAKPRDPPRAPIPFVPLDQGYCVYNASRPRSERTGNYAAPANVDTLYVHRALVVTARTAQDRPDCRWLGADLAKTDLSGMNLDGADLTKAQLQRCRLRGTSLQGARLNMADLEHANLTGANLSGANLSNASLFETFMPGVNLRGANLEGADLLQAVLDGADLTRANIDGVNFDGASLDGVTLRYATWSHDTVLPAGFDPFALCATLPLDADLSAGGLARYIDKMRATGTSIGLELDRLEQLSDEDAEVVAGFAGSVSLNGLTTLSDRAAEALSRHAGRLSLDGLTTLSDHAAVALAQHAGGLSLDGFVTLSDRVAEALSRHRGTYLSLNGLTTLSDHAGVVLSQHNGGLCLGGLTTLSDRVAEALSRHTGGLSLDGVTTLSNAAADALARYKDVIDLSSLSTLTSAALATRLVSAIALDQIGQGQSRLESWEEDTQPRCWSDVGNVALPAVTELSPAAAQAIVEAIHAVAKEFPDWDDFWDDESHGQYHEGSLELDGLRSLSVEVARELAGHNGHLQLCGVTALSPAAAEALAGIGCHMLDLSGLREMSDDVAEALAKHEGSLRLTGLDRVSDALRQRFTPSDDFPGVYWSNARPT